MLENDKVKTMLTKFGIEQDDNGGLVLPPEMQAMMTRQTKKGINKLLHTRTKAAGALYGGFMVSPSDDTPSVAFVAYGEDGEPLNKLEPEKWTPVIMEATENAMSDMERIAIEAVVGDLDSPEITGAIQQAGRVANAKMTQELEPGTAVMILPGKDGSELADFYKVTVNEMGYLVNVIEEIPLI